MGWVSIIDNLLDRQYAMLISMSMDVCSDSEVDGCCCSFRLWRSFDFKPWKYFLNLFLFASWLGWLVCVLCCKIFEDDQAPSLSKINEKFVYQPKSRQIKPTKLWVRKDIDHSFKAWNPNYAIIWNCNSSHQLENQCSRPLTLKWAWYVNPAKWIRYFLIPLPTASRQKHTPFPLINRKCCLHQLWS